MTPAESMRLAEPPEADAGGGGTAPEALAREAGLFLGMQLGRQVEVVLDRQVDSSFL